MPATLVASIYIVLSVIIYLMHLWLMPTIYGVVAVITIVSIARILTSISGEG